MLVVILVITFQKGVKHEKSLRTTVLGEFTLIFTSCYYFIEFYLSYQIFLTAK